MMEAFTAEWWASAGTGLAASWAAVEAFSARRSAGRAARLSEPMGDGFADSVTTSLKEIKDMVHESRVEARSDTSRVERKIDEHVRDHAASDVRRRRLDHGHG